MKNSLHDNLLCFVWHFLKNYKLLFFGIVITTVSWCIGSAVAPYFFSKFLDSFSEMNSDFYDSVKIVLPYILYIIFAQVFLLDFGHSLRKHLSKKLYPKLKRDIKVKSFEYIFDYSISFFANNMSGSLGGKINNLANSSVDVIRYFIHDLFQTLVLTLVFFLFWINR